VGTRQRRGTVVRMGWVAGLLLGLATPIGAAVSITAEPRTELLYSTTKDVDCTKLFGTPSDMLPFNIVRLRALVDGAAPDSSVRLQWSFKGTPFGELAADLDLGPTGNLPVVTAMCADFGNQCVLADTALQNYSHDTILFVAPTCDDLDRDPS